MNMFRLSLLGPIEITRNNTPLDGFESRKALGLLCYLVEKGQPVSRSHLADLFWGDKSESRGRANLSRALHNLSTLLPDAFTADRNTLGFRRSPQFWIDLDIFEELVMQGDMEALGAATALYRDEFMADLYVDGCPDFETWIVTKREQWHRRIALHLQQLISHYTDRGDYEQGLHFASRLLALDPWREEGHRYMMRLLAYNGQRTAALKQYETCCRILSEELDVAPAAETTDLYDQIRRSRAEEELQSTAGMLPFVDRAEEHAWLVSQWKAAHAGQGKFTLIEGDAGLGKTRLVQEALRPLSRSGVLTIIGCCRDFGSPIPYQPITDAIREHVIGMTPPAAVTQALSTVSDVWLRELTQLLPELGDIRPSVQTSQQIAGDTARHRLFEAVAQLLYALIESYGAVVVFLDDLHRAEQSTVDLLRYLIYRLQNKPAWFVGTYLGEETVSGNPFAELLYAFTWQQQVAHLSLEPLPRDAIKTLVHDLLNMDPPFVESLTGHLADISAGSPFLTYHLIHRMEERGALQRVNNKWRLGNKRLFQDIIDSSRGSNGLSTIAQEIVLQQVERLPKPSRQLLEYAAVIGHSFDPVVLQKLAVPTETIAEILDEWVSHRLVSAEEGVTYNFEHDIVRLAVYNSIPIWRRRQLHGRVAETLTVLHSEDDARIVEQLAYHYKESGNGDQALRYWLRAAERAEETYAWDLVLKYCSQALTLLADGQLASRYDILGRHERACHNAAQREDQDADLRELETLATKLADPVRLVDVYCRRAEWAFSTGRFTTGIFLAREAMDRARECGRPELAAESLRYGALCLNNVGNYREANQWAVQAHTLCVEADDRHGQASALNILGVIALGQGFIDKAQRYLEETITEWRRIDDVRHLALTLSIMSTLYQRKGEYQHALDIQLETRRLVAQVGDVLLNANSIISLGRIYHTLGRYDLALEAYSLALSMGQAAAAPKIQATALLSRAHTFLAMGQIAKAEDDYSESLAMQTDIGAVVLRLETISGLVDCDLARAKFAHALKRLADADVDGIEIERSGVSEILVRQAEAYAGLGDLNKAYSMAKRAASMLREPDAYVTDVASIWHVAGILNRCDDTEQVQPLLSWADDLIQQRADSLSDPILRNTFLEATATRQQNLTAL